MVLEQLDIQMQKKKKKGKEKKKGRKESTHRPYVLYKN